MYRCLRTVAVAAAFFGFAAASAATGAQAQTVALPHGLYASIDAGVIVPQSISMNSVTSSGGTTTTISGNLNMNAGPATGFILGWHVMPMLALEANFEYANVGLQSITGNIVARGALNSAAPFTFGVNGNIDTFNGLFNALWTPFGAGSWYGIKPYIGAGVGFSNFTETINSLTLSGLTTQVNTSASRTDFAANGIIGFDVDVMPSLSLGGRYRFVYINTASSAGNPGFGATGSSGDFYGHVLTANATWHF